MRLRSLLATAFALLALALTLVGAVSVQHLASARLRERIGGEVAGLAAQIRTLLDAAMYERWSDMQVLARIAATVPSDAAGRRAWIEALQQAYPSYAWIGFAQADGTVTASTKSLLEGVSVAARPWFKAGLTGPHAGDVHEAVLLAKLLPPLASGEPHRFVDVAAPVRDAAGAVVGVIGGHLSWSWADKVAADTLAAAQTRGARIQAIVLGRDGTVLLGPPGLRGTRLPADTAQPRADASDGHALETWPDGVTYLVGSSRSTGLRDYPGLGWTVRVLQPADAAFAPARTLSLEIAAGGAAFAALFALIGWSVAGRIARPLLALTEAAEAAGRDGIRTLSLPPERGAAEVRTLTRSFGALMARLAQRDRALEDANRTLEAQVADRTRALGENRAFLENVLRTSPDCIAVLDPDDRIGFITDQGVSLFEFEGRAAALGCRLPDLLPPESRPALQAALAEARAGRTVEVTLFCPTRKGSRRWWSLALAPMRGEGGSESVLVVARDVTRLEDQADALRLSRDVAELAQARAENASRAKTDFLAMMSHEIRTPLNSILGFTDLMLDGSDLAPGPRRQAELIRSSGSALLTVVDDILDFSKVEAGAIELAPRPFSPAALVADCVAIIRGVADAKRLEIRTRLDPALPPGLVGDEARLRQVLLNLLNNAVKFTGRGHVTIALRHEGIVDAGERIRFSVSDTGPGIPREKHDRLFQRFSQVDGSLRRDVGGTGLGLAISRQLIALMGGEIGVISEAGEGATFWFELALPRGAVATRLAEAPPSARQRRGARLLLVEDVVLNQEVARAVLEVAGHGVDVVGDGQSAVAAVQRTTYDLVLMDVQMPGMDGMSATRAIRALRHPSRRVPIVAMTANVLPEQVRQFLEAGMNDHVAKPFKRAELYTTIDRWLPDVMLSDEATKSATGAEAAAPFERARTA